MPTYEFRCTACKNPFEVSRPMGKVEPTTCPVCGSEAKRVYSPVGVSFKGSGFHNTDYRPKPADDSGSCPSKGDASPACADCPAAK